MLVLLQPLYNDIGDLHVLFCELGFDFPEDKTQDNRLLEGAMMSEPIQRLFIDCLWGNEKHGHQYSTIILSLLVQLILDEIQKFGSLALGNAIFVGGNHLDI